MLKCWPEDFGGFCRGGDLAPSLGGRQKNFAEKIYILTPKNSDDLFCHRPGFSEFLLSLFRFSVSLLYQMSYQMSYMTLSSQEKALFSRRKILMTFFVIDQVFLNFDSLFSDSLYLYCIKCHIKCRI